MSLNRAMVIGTLGNDPALRHLPTGQPEISFSVVTDESFKGERRERLESHRVVAVGRLAETCSQHLKKGGQVVCCESFIGDGGGPPGVGLQEQAPNHHKLPG